jgi:cation:H+ antiporter
MMLLLSIVALIGSMLLLYMGSEGIIHVASRLAHSLNFHKTVVGTVFVASITSIPELISSITAALLGSSEMALGNIIGSNIYNVPLIIGICGLIGTFKIKNSTVEKECLFMIGLATLLMILTLTTHAVTWWMGLIFLTFYPAFIYYSTMKGKGETEDSENLQNRNLTKPVIFMTLSGSALLAGTFLLLYSTVTLAELFGLSQFYAGSMIMALGCVVPEVATSIVAAYHGEQEISIGNVIGDNIITMTLVLGIVALIKWHFTVFTKEILMTAPFMILVTFVLFLMNKWGRKITKPWSMLMLAIAIVSFVIQKLN